MNPPATPIRAVWRSAGSSPYSLIVGTSLSRSNALETIAYSRQLLYAQEDGAVLAVRLFAPQITGENKVLDFPAVTNDDSLLAESLAEKLTFDFVVPANAEEAKVDVEVYTKEAGNLLESGASALQIGFELIDLVQNSQVVLAMGESVALSSDATSSKSVSLSLAAVRGKMVRLRPVLYGLDLGKARGALVHEYGVDESGAHQGKVLAAQTVTNSHEFSVWAHPNPFNPSTNIQFNLSTESLVTLRIYNLQGQLVRELLHEQRVAGPHQVIWNGRDDHGITAASGIYFIRLESGNHVKVSKLTLVR